MGPEGDSGRWLPPTAEVTAEVSYNQFIETAEFSIRVSPSHSYNAGRAGLGCVGGWP